jgi:hypothetical protein
MPVPSFGCCENKNSWAVGELPGCGVLPDPQLKDLTKVFLLLCY